MASIGFQRPALQQQLAAGPLLGSGRALAAGSERRQITAIPRPALVRVRRLDNLEESA
jgi:hypothetical protein